MMVSPLPRPGEVAAEQRVRARGGRGRVSGSGTWPPHPAFGHLLPRWGEGTWMVSPLPFRERSLRSSG